MTLVQVVPRLPPPLEGVGGYAAALAGALSGGHGIETRFVVGDPAWSGDGGALRVAERSAPALRAALEEAGNGGVGTVFLHYSGYGYHRRGCPAWLVEGLLCWRAARRGRRLVTAFHEVYAMGTPWRSSFWLSPLQRRLAAALAGASAGVATSLDRYAGLLRPWVPGRPVVVLPVFSTVGEPDAVAPLAARRRRLVVFGGAGVRGRAWGAGLPALAAACARLDVEEVVDVGPPAASPPPAAVAGVPVSAAGVLPAAEVGALLAESLAGFLAYPPPYLAKSTIFAAYCAHGVLPVCAWSGADGADGEPREGRHYWRPRTSARSRPAPAPADPQAIADAARRWYAGHALARHGALFAELLA